MDAKKMMLVIGGEHDGAAVEVEDYTFAVRLPLMPTPDDTAEGTQRYALYTRATIQLLDDDGTSFIIEFLRGNKMTTKAAIEARLLPSTSGSKPS